MICDGDVDGQYPDHDSLNVYQHFPFRIFEPNEQAAVGRVR